MKRLFYFFLLLFIIPFTSVAQQDSCNLRITLLTCSPGAELYSTFGHTAIRVTDKMAGGDYVFNYGTFEFGPDFYTKFIKGKLNYYLSVESFADFIYSYQYESRSVVEQELQFSCAEKQKLFDALKTNAQPENRYYKYDFLFDNCTTRARDIVAANTAAPVVFKNILPADVPTFRNLIHSYLNLGGQYWSKLGIDILLGAKLDKKVSNLQAMFLPDYLLKGFDNAYTGAKPLVTPATDVLKMPSPLDQKMFFRPAVVFALLAAFVLALFFINKRWAKTALSVFDFLFFFILGLAGVLLIFMWFGTDHSVTKNNYNLLWALPTHLVMAFVAFKNTGWVKRYFKIVFFISVVLLLAWAFLPQQMNAALLPIVLLIIFRSWHLSTNRPYATKENKY